MIVRCEKCGSALTFDVATGKMKCEYCGLEKKAEKIVMPDDNVENTMDCNIYACTACGAELAVSDMEAATFCAYCGQPTIVFDRVSKMYKPEKIIPFKVTREQAELIIRKRFRKGFFIPKEIKEFEVEHMVGVYVPFWLYDLTYYDLQRYNTSRIDCCSVYYREAEANFGNVTVDASSHIHNELTHRLEPFYLAELKDFRESYLSGFFADRYDQDAVEMRTTAGMRCKVLFDEEVRETIDTAYAKLVSSEPQCKVNKLVYAMFPIWFMTLVHRGQPYTILVNGQTGKIVGTVPVKKSRVWCTFTVLFGVLAPTLSWVFSNVYEAVFGQFILFRGSGIYQWMACTACTAGILCYACWLGRNSFRIFCQHIAQISERKITRFSRNRQRKGK